METNPKPKRRHAIPRQLTKKQFNRHIKPHLSRGRRGPKPKLSFFKTFNYILKLVHTGTQWEELAIEKNKNGKPEIHYSRLHRVYTRWLNDDSLKHAFENTVDLLYKNNLLDPSVFHGDGSLTAAKKGGDLIGYNGHKKIKGETILPIIDRNINVIAPYTTAPANRNESPLFGSAIKNLKDMAKNIGFSLVGSILSWDASVDCPKNRKIIFNAGMKPNINENKRGRKKTKRGRKQLFDKEIYKERFRTIERLFSWEDTFKRLIIRFERKSKNHFGLKLIAYTMINLRHFCTP